MTTPLSGIVYCP